MILTDLRLDLNPGLDGLLRRDGSSSARKDTGSEHHIVLVVTRITTPLAYVATPVAATAPCYSLPIDFCVHAMSLLIFSCALFELSR